MLRMALNGHAKISTQRKQGLLTRLAFIIAFCTLLSPIICTERDVCNVLTLKLYQHTSFMRAVIVQYGLVVQHVFRLCMSD